MPLFYSPTGNPEVWDEHPGNGYISKEEHDAALAAEEAARLAEYNKLENVKARALAQIDESTSTRILAGFEFQPEGHPEPLRFSYDLFDQQNFADAANAALLAQAGTPGVPESVGWNAYHTDTGELVRLTLTPAQFLTLYVAGALAHKAACMEVGGRKKAAVEAATTADEVAAVLAS